MPDEPQQQPPTDPTQAFQRRLAKYDGDAMAFATQLFDENFRLREEKRTLTEKLTDAEKKLPAEGAVVLSADKAKDYEAYKALGKVEDLTKRLDDHAGLETKVKDLEHAKVIDEVAAIANYKPSILADRDKAAGGLEFIIKVDPTSKRKAAYVKQEDKEISLAEFAEANWADYLPSLKVEQGQTQPTPRIGTDPRPIGQNGKEAYEHSHQTLARSGKYGM